MARVRVLRVIARLNMGGPAHQAALLSGRRFDPDRYETLLVHGSLAPGEESLAAEAEREGATMRQLPSLIQPLSPGADARAFAGLSRLIRGFRPDIVHTHTAKAGMLGRCAAIATPGKRPALLHTFHGHVLEGYFGARKSALFRNLEAGLARRTDVLIGVSQATVDDLVRLRVADRGSFRVVPLGLDLERFTEQEAVAADAARLRSEAGAGEADVLCTFLGRIVPIKRLDLLLEAIAVARRSNDSIRLLVVGDGDGRPRLEARAEALGIGDSVHFAGYRSDLPAIWAASDLAVLSSDNEGTPVSLIEAGAAGVSAVSTDAGGVRETVAPEASIVVPVGDAEALGRGIAELAGDPARRHAAGAAAREFTLERFSADRLIDRIDELYGELLAML